VTLSAIVRSWAEISKADSAAWGAPGEKNVF